MHYLISIAIALFLALTALIQYHAKEPTAPPELRTPTPSSTPIESEPKSVKPAEAEPLPPPTPTPAPPAEPDPKPSAEIEPPPPTNKDNETPSVEKTNEAISYKLKAIPIDLRSIVGLSCDFKNLEGTEAKYRGSGVIIKKGTYTEGTYILTNRHVVDIQWTKKITQDPNIDPNLELSGCRVHILNTERSITPEETYPYPYYDLHLISGRRHDFTAKVAYLPKTDGFSQTEDRDLDYAILELTGKNNDKYFENENPKLASAPVLIPSPKEWIEVIKENRVVMPGYAFQQEGQGSFDEFRLLTKDGKVKEVYVGEKALEQVPFLLDVEVPPDAYGGRSGSPIFYQGYLVGLVATKALPKPNSKDFTSTQPAITGIIDNLNTQNVGTKNLFEKVFYLNKPDE